MSCCAKLFIGANSRNYSVTQYFGRLPGVSRLSEILFFRCSESSRGICDSILQQSPVEIITQLPSNESFSQSTKKSNSSPKKCLSSGSVTSYLKTCADISDIQSIPQKFLKRLRHAPEGLFVVSSTIANTIVEHVMSQNVGSVPLFEVNPGTGSITKAFLEKGVNEIHVFQSSFWTSLSKLVKVYPERIHVHEVDFFVLWKRMFIDGADRQEDIQKILSIIEPKQWHDVPTMKILAAVPKKAFIHHVMAALIFQKGFFLRGRPEFYLMMKPFDYHCYTCKKSEGYVMYRASSVLFQILFETSLLCKLQLQDFIPWTQEMATKRKIYLPPSIENDADNIYLIKVTPRQELYDVIGGIDNLQPLWHFVRQCFTSRNNKVIPLLEKWIPGCGPRLIFKGMNIFTRFGELSPSDMLDLFLQFSKWPEYQDCSFLASLETSALKSYVDSNQESIHDSEFDSTNDPAVEHLTYNPTSNSDTSSH